jgi:hypothetical protein
MSDNNLLTDDFDINDIPEKFLDKPSGRLRIKAMNDSYRELERKLSSQPSIPSSPEDYNIDCSHGLFEVDRDMNRTLHRNGFTQEQVQTVYDLAAEKMVPLIVQLAHDYQADREIDKLINHFCSEEHWREGSRRLLAFGRENLPSDVLDTLASSFEGVVALYGMMKSEEPGISRQASTQESAGLNELYSMMRDPKYWRDRDPSFVAKVTEGFQKVYGE